MKPIMATSLALLALAFNGLASAGTLIDERTHPATPAPASQPAPTPAGAPVTPSAASGGRITGDITGAAWSTQSPRPKSVETLSSAILELRPDELPVTELEAPDSSLLDIPVTWTVPSTRVDALAQIAARYNVNLAISESNVTIAKVATPTKPRDPNAPLPKHPFEVKLGDVKLSTTFDRWAREGGVTARWDADKHVLIEAQMTFMATDVFDAISQALATPGIQDSEYPLEVCEYPNTPKLLRVTRQGDQVKDCPN